MQKKRIIILGAGISGLSCAFYLSKFHEVIVLEKTARCGGLLQTERQGGFLFEQGARTFKMSRAKALLQLAEELGLRERMIFSAFEAESRYLCLNNKLKKMPRPLLSLSLLNEWRVAPCAEEETIYDFGRRRFGKKIAERLFDPLAIGVFAGDARTLSINSCFPYFKQLEARYGSLTKGFFKERRGHKDRSLFSFTGGVQTLIDALQERLHEMIHLNEKAMKLAFSEQGVAVHTRSNIFKADLVVSALPAPAIATLFPDQEIAELLASIKMQSLCAIQLGFKEEILPFKAFGYLVPSSEQLPLYGAVFDSAIFPQHNRRAHETRITLMAKDDAEAAIAATSIHLKRPLHPNFLHVSRFKEVIPQFEIGHQKKLERLKTLLERYPACRLIGNYWGGASVNDCVQAGASLCS